MGIFLILCFIVIIVDDNDISDNFPIGPLGNEPYDEVWYASWNFEGSVV